MEPSEETEDQEPRPIFFEFRTEIDAFETTFMDLIRKLIQGANPLPPENTQRITHGMTWTHHARPELGRGQIETHSATWELGFHEVVDGDLTALPRSAQVIVTGFQRHLMTSLYQVVSDASDAVGNTVSAAEEGGFAAAFLEGFRRIELAVGRDGKVSMPELHTGTNAQKLIAELEAQPPEYHAEIERLKAEKTAAALAREEGRKAKFKQSDAR